MGFFGFISSCVSGICNVVKGVGAAVCSFAGSAIKAVGSLVPVLGKWVGTLSTAIQVISLVVEVVSRIMALLKTDETVPEMGERVLQAEERGITLESCNNSFDAYMEKLRNLKLDPHKAEMRSPEEKTLAGCLLLENGLKLKYPIMMTADMWPIIVRNADFFSKERLMVYAKLAQERNIPFGESIGRYFTPSDNINGNIDKNTRNFLFDAEQQLNPGVTKNSISDLLDGVKKNCMTEKEY